MLERHLLDAVDRVKKEYDTMEWGTVGHSELKGNVGRDLAALVERLEHVQAHKQNMAKIDRVLSSQGSEPVFEL